jgi:hypothetical protein
MNFKSARELHSYVSDLFYYEDYRLSKSFNIWEYWYELFWDTIKLTLKDTDDIKIFRWLISKNWTDSPNISELWYEWSLELLFHHYPYWYTNWSNCILINWEWDVIAIQYNWSTDNCVLINHQLKKERYIVINNKKKLEYDLKYKDFNSIEDWLRRNFT